MYTIERKVGGYGIFDENGLHVGSIKGGDDAHEAVTAWNLVEEMVRRFPGLLNGETDVNGGDLVDFITSRIKAAEWRGETGFMAREQA